MGRKSKVSSEVKITAVEDYLKGEKSVLRISNELSVSKESVRQWIRIYQSTGASGLIHQAGKGSLLDISLKYRLHSKRQLETWLMKYNGYEEIKSSGAGGNQIMTTGRKTTLEERIECAF